MDARTQNALEIYKARLKAAGKRQGSGAATTGAQVVNDDISRSLDLIREDQDGFWGNFFKADLPATGWFSYLSALPGTDAKALSNRLRTIQANISFDKLQAMREASPTGGALGQVSTFELQNLMAVFGSLEQSQSAEDLEYNLLRLRRATTTSSTARAITHTAPLQAVHKQAQLKSQQCCSCYDHRASPNTNKEITMSQQDLNAFADWLVANQSKKGTPEYDTVAAAFQELDAQLNPPNTSLIGGMADSALRIGQGIVDFPQTVLDAVTGQKDTRLHCTRFKLLQKGK